jgi:membrane protein
MEALMARLSDLAHVYRTIGPVGFLRRVWSETLDDNVFTWAAALAYSWMFAIFPFLIFLLALLPYLPDRYKDTAAVEIKQMLGEAIPSAAGESLQQTVDRFFATPAAGILSLGILVALYGASGGMNATMAALDRAYDLEIGRPFLVQRGVATVLTVVVATLILLVLCLLPVGTEVLRFLKMEGVALWLFNAARYGLALILCLTILSLIYHFGPSVRSHWTWLSPGSLFVVVVWVALGFAFRYYIDNFAAASYAKTYGVVGSIVLLLLVLYVDAIVLLVGAEINSEVDFAVLGMTSSSQAGRPSVARENLSPRERRMAEELRRRRPGAVAMAAMAARGRDPASAGAVYPASASAEAAAPARDGQKDA